MTEVLSRIVLGIAAALVFTSCSDERCSDLSAGPLGGVYRGLIAGNSKLNATDVVVRADGEQVILTYRRPDGVSVKATYRVVEKGDDNVVAN